MKGGVVEISQSKKARGFSLPEILVVMALASVLAFSFLLNVRTSSDRLKSEGLARALTEELRAARAMAAQEQTEILVAFPAVAGGAACRSFRVYQGEDVLNPVRVCNFDQEYDSYIFAGTWPAQQAWMTASTIEQERVDELGDYNVILFRPDGSIQTNLPQQNGAVCLVVDNALDYGLGERFFGTLEATQNPNTVVVQPSGSISLIKGLYNASTELVRTTEQPALTRLDPLEPPPTSGPVIQDISFSPRSSVNGGPVGMGKTYIEIHPISGDTRSKEYGLAIITAEATDAGGGPLFMEVTVTPSDGPPGTLAADGPVRMEYLNGRWVGSVGWRPPADAEPQVSYDFGVVISNPRGLTTEAASDASVLPVLQTLIDNRLALQSANNEIHLANLNGGELVAITPPGIQEEHPIWSADGTKLFVLAQAEGGRYDFVRYNADGTGRQVVSSFPPDASGFEVDPSGMYLKYLHGPSQHTFNTLGADGPTVSTVTTYTLSVLHVSNGGSQTAVAGDVTSGGDWMGNQQGALQYSVLSVGTVEGPTYDAEGNVDEEAGTTTYDKVGSSLTYAMVSGLSPDVSSFGVHEAASVEGAAFNPDDPNFCALPARGGGSTPPSLSIQRNVGGLGKWVADATVSVGAQIVGVPAWSSNGQWLCYLTRLGESSTSLHVHRVILPAPDAPVGTAAIVEGALSLGVPSGVSHPLVTPDGRSVLYIVGVPGTSDSQLMKADTDGSAPVQIGVNLGGVTSYAITF